MNKLVKALTAAGVLAAAFNASAATTINQPFSVKVDLTSACTMTAPSAVQFTYTSFQGAAATSTGGAFSVSCTNTLPYTVAITGASTTVSGLTYALALSAASGTGATHTVTVTY